MSQKLPVTKDGKRGSEVIILEAKDIIRIDKVRERDFIVHTKTDKYYFHVSFDMLEEWLFEDGFRTIDATNIVNMNLVEAYDPDKGIVYFGDQYNRKTKAASVARIHKSHIENMLKMIILAKEEEKERIYSDTRSEQMLASLANETDNEKFLRSYATIHAVTARKKAEAKIAHVAYHDMMTQLPNRLFLQEKLNQFLDVDSENPKLLSIFFLDVDRFKIINDTLGHYVGDMLLQQVAQRLNTFIGNKGFVTRFGGDEFIVLLNNAKDEQELEQIAIDMIDLLSFPFYVGNHEFYATASIGISIYPKDGLDTETLIKNADMAMYMSKERGGNSYHFYNNEINGHSVDRIQFENDFRKALERNEFIIYYQPFLDVANNKIVGMEALIRWNRANKGVVSPRDFIPLAEETGQIIPIGEWVIQQACSQLKSWEQDGYDDLYISVNLSVHQLQDNLFLTKVKKVLEQTQLDPKKLCLEITESAMLKHSRQSHTMIDELSKLGLKIFIDDFGTGYASLSSLKRFRFDTLKIDRSFIFDITTSADSRAIVNALIMMAKELNILSLAEGVETKEQFNLLKELKCELIQGFIFSHPLPVEGIEKLLQTHNP